MVCVGGQTDGGIVGFVAGQAWRRGRSSSSSGRRGRGGERARETKTKSQKQTRTEHTLLCDRSGGDIYQARRVPSSHMMRTHL